MGRTQAVEPGSAASAPVRILCSAAPQEALRTLGPAFERATGRRVAFTFAFAPEVQQRLDAGETADAVILPVRLPAMLEKSRSWRAERPLILARVGIGVIVHRSARLPDISTVEAVRTLLLEARAIAWPDSRTPIGNHLNQAIAHLGIADALRPKLIMQAAIHGGAELVARGEADVGLYLVSEIRSNGGVTGVGLLPSELQHFVIFGAAIPTCNKAPDPALAFLKFISDPGKAEHWTAAGFEPARPQSNGRGFE